MFPRFIIQLRRLYKTIQHCPTGWPRFRFLIMKEYERREGRGEGPGDVYIAELEHAQWD